MKKSLFIILIVIGLTTGIGVFIQKIKKDRERARGFAGPEVRIERTVSNGTKREVKTYTQKDLEEARKKGTLPKDLNQPMNQNLAVNQGDAATQRALKTVEEINKINEMNQRLMDQQRRIQNQR